MPTPSFGGAHFDGQRQVDPARSGGAAPPIPALDADFRGRGRLRRDVSDSSCGHPHGPTQLLTALDGTTYHYSHTVHCPQCAWVAHRHGGAGYHDSVVTPVVVMPGRSEVLARPPESVVPDKAERVEKERAYTQEAAHNIPTHPKYDNKTSVILCEHKHLASRNLERELPGQEVTFRQLPHLGQMRGVPQTWPKGIYDYIWVIKYSKGAVGLCLFV